VLPIALPNSYFYLSAARIMRHLPSLIDLDTAIGTPIAECGLCDWPNPIGKRGNFFAF
jgi:hypothetical protein